MNVRRAALLACVAVLTLAAPAAMAGPWGEYDAKCKKIDGEWKDLIIKAHKVYVTMHASQQGLKSGDDKVAKKWKDPIYKFAKDTLKFLETTSKTYAKNWNAKAIDKELESSIRQLTGKMDKIKTPYTKDGKRFKDNYNAIMGAISVGGLQSAREAVLTAELCYYDLAQKEPHDPINWPEFNRTLKKEIEDAGPGL